MKALYRCFNKILVIAAVLAVLLAAAPGLSLKSMAASTNDTLVSLKKLDSDFIYDIRYATTRNFTGRKLYPSSIACLQESTAWKLVKANEEVMKKGYRIKIWDAYRPYSVQVAMWKSMPDSRFLADPYKGGSKHNRGAAVDVTLVDSKGKELEMPSSFDEFSIKASRNDPGMTATARKNLKVLTDAMVKSGFKAINTEWWHYDDTESSKYPLLDTKPEDAAKRPLPVENLKCVKASDQVILVTNSSAKSSKATLQTFEKTEGKWLKVFPDMQAYIGKNGFKKVKGSVLSNADKAVYKHEGDGCSPMGAFTITTLFGWGKNPGFNIPYRLTGQDDYWVSGSTRDTYNVMVNRKGGPDKSWPVYEKLNIPQYKYAALIDYNTGRDRIVGNGSAIFLHIAGQKGYTSGCTALSEANLLKILKWLEPDKKPLIVQGTPAEIETFASPY